MKTTSIFLTAILSVGSITAQSQEQTVLRHIEPEEATATHNYWGETFDGSPGWGYYLGHNLWGDEAFAEKYEISSSGRVLGVIAHFSGKATSSGQIRFKVYSEGTNGLPNQTLGQQAFTFQDVPTDGTAHSVMFTDPVDVEEAFFVALDLGDYSHDPLQGDTLCLLAGEDGSRPASDDEFGRNAIRWHSHGTENWKDFYTENFTPVSTYFAIYPIMEGNIASVDGIFVNDQTPTIYPLPAQDNINVNMNLRDAREVTARIIDMEGRELRAQVFFPNAGEAILTMDMIDLAAGNYILAIESGVFRHAQIIVKN